MRTVLTILLIAVIGGICALEAVFIRQGRRMPKRSCVRLSVAYPIVGVVFGAMFLYLMNMAVHEQDSNPWVAMGFLVFVLMGVSLILAWINYRIWYDSSGFIIRNVLGVRRDYTYSDITGLLAPHRRALAAAGSSPPGPGGDAAVPAATWLGRDRASCHGARAGPAKRDGAAAPAGHAGGAVGGDRGRGRTAAGARPLQ